MLKKFFSICTIISLMVLFGACSSGATRYKDGTYKEEAAEYSESGWKDSVEVVIKDGKITFVNWDGVSNNPEITVSKKEYSKEGLYGMKAGGAQAEWHEEAEAVEKFVVDNNGVDKIKVNNNGKTDSVSGATLFVSQFVSLTQKCLDDAKK